MLAPIQFNVLQMEVKDKFRQSRKKSKSFRMTSY